MQSRTPAMPDAQLQDWKQFVLVLEAERAALIANDGDQIAGLAERKAECAQRLQKVSRHAPIELLALVRQAQDLNRLNSALLHQRISQTQQALALLRPSNAHSAGVYGRDGRSDTNNSGRGFAVA